MSLPSKQRFESLLVVDDNEMNRDLLKRRLEEVGYLVTTLEGGRAALERMQHETYDLLLLDMMMPEIDGFQVLAEMKKNDKMRRIPVMMVTAVNDMENVVKCINMGARDYVAKPFDPGLLKARVAKILEKYPAAQRVTALSGTTRNDIRVLVVDDESLNRDLVVAQLARLGYVPDVAVSGSEALAKLADGSYDCVLLDIMMPEIDGFEVLRRIRSTDGTKNMPVVMLSARDDAETIEKCTSHGATDYLTKPFHSVILNVRIRQALVAENGVATTFATPTAARPGGDKKTRVIADVKKRMLGNALELPVVSDVGMSVTQMCLLPDVNLKDLTDVVKLDASLTTKLLAIANSNFYKGLKKVETLGEAITRIGLNETKRYAATLAGKNAYQGGTGLTAKVAEKVWHHALAVAQAARELAEMCNLGDPERFYTLGLIHDVGVSVVLRVVDDAYKDDDQLTVALIDEIAAAVHAEVGGYITERWKLPDEYSRAIRLHHTEDYSKTPIELNVLALAHACADELGTGYGETTLSPDIVKAIKSQLGIADEAWVALVGTVRGKVDNIKALV